MKILELNQNTPEWLEWREGRYTASNAAAVMNAGVFYPRTPYELFHSVGKEVFVTQAMKDGNAYEPRALELVNAAHAVEYRPLCAENDDHGLPLGASYDGVSEDRTRAVEIKTPAQGSKSDLWSADVIPAHYFWQMQHQLLTMPSLQVVTLVVYAKDIDAVTMNLSVSRDDIAFPQHQSGLLTAWQIYHACITKGEEPPLCDRDTVHLSEDSLLGPLMTKYVGLKREHDAVKDELEKVRKEILEIAESDHGRRPVACAGVKVTWAQRKGAPSLRDKALRARIDEAGIDLKDYTPGPTWYARLTS